MLKYIFSVFFSVFLLSYCNSAHSSVTGSIKYEGKVPKFKAINMGGDPVCMAKHTSPCYPEVLVLGDDNYLANVVVYIENAPEGDYPVPAEHHILDQKGCIYTPHVSVARVGQDIKILNPDGTLHNVHAIPKVNAEFNMAMPKFRKQAMKKFDKKEMPPFPFKCDVHPWMTAWVGVLDHPFYAVTSKDGKFSINNLPDGSYNLIAWHEKLGEQKISVVVKDGNTDPLSLVFKRG